jgi:hypothetical protein
MADEPWTKFQSDTPAQQPWEKFQAPAAQAQPWQKFQATAPTMAGPEVEKTFGKEKPVDPSQDPEGPVFQKGWMTNPSLTGQRIAHYFKTAPSAAQQFQSATEKDIEAYKRGGPSEVLKNKDDLEEKIGLATGFVGGGLVKAGKLPPVVSNNLNKIINPQTASPMAESARASIRASGGEAARATEQTAAAMEPYHRAVNAASQVEKRDFVDHVEGGAGKPTAELAPLAGKLREAYEVRRKKLESMPATAKAEFIDDFYPHMWKDPNSARNAANTGGGGAGKQGSGASLKKRTIPTIKEGLDAGLEPISDDPIEVTMRYVSSMDKFIAQQEVFQAAKDSGVIKFVKPKVMGASGNPDSLKIPDGYAPLQGRGAKNIQGEQAYAPSEWAKIYNNYISRGFHENDTAGKVYDAVQGVSNGITAMELGLSGYHAFTMANEAMISDVAKGISQIVGGKPMTGLGSMARAPAAPVTRYLSGKKGEQIYLGRTPGAPDLRRLVDLQTKAGGRAVGKGHSPDYRFNKMGSYWTAFKRGALKAEMAQSKANVQASPLWGGPKELVKAIGRTMETVAQPIFEKYIPRLKNGAFYDTMGEWLKANPNATYDQQVAMARKIWDSIDNRFGEMVQDNIFWNKTMKQVAQVAMRSYSWNMGTFREIGGGIAGLAKHPERVSMKHPDYDPRAAYVLALPIVVATTSAAYQYLKTGKTPESPEDLVAPRTGGTSPGFGGRGEVEERAMLPGYHKDVLGWYNDWKQEAANKVAKGPHMAFQAVQPGGMKDFAGQPVIDPTSQGPAWLGQYFKWAADSISPISIKQLAQGQKTGSGLGSIESMMGVRPAPMWLQDPEGTQRGMAAIARRDANKKRKADLRKERQYGGPQE